MDYSSENLVQLSSELDSLDSTIEQIHLLMASPLTSGMIRVTPSRFTPKKMVRRRNPHHDEVHLMMHTNP